jgi:cell filamentation protein
VGTVHIELILIHPFREGNGRTARLLADLMVMQANKPSLNFAAIDKTTNEKGFQQYILAIHAGVSGNYKPIQEIFKKLLKESTT